MNLFLFKQSPFELNDLESACQLIKASDKVVLMYDASYFVKELNRFSGLIDTSQLSVIKDHCIERQLTSEDIPLLSMVEFTKQCFAAKHVLSI